MSAPPDDPIEIWKVLPPGQIWRDAAVVAAFGGVDTDATGKGVHKLTIIASKLTPLSGFYELYYEVV